MEKNKITKVKGFDDILKTLEGLKYEELSKGCGKLGEKKDLTELVDVMGVILNIIDNKNNQQQSTNQEKMTCDEVEIPLYIKELAQQLGANFEVKYKSPSHGAVDVSKIKHTSHTPKHKTTKPNLNIKDISSSILEKALETSPIDVVAKEYGVSIDKIKFLCDLWGIKERRKTHKLIHIQNRGLINIIEGYYNLSVNSTGNMRAKLETKLVCDINQLIRIIEVGYDKEKYTVVPLLNPSSKAILVPAKLEDVLAGIKTNGLKEYVRKLELS